MSDIEAGWEPDKAPTPPAEDPEGPILSLHGVTKRFNGLAALSEVSLELWRGECHALLGQNGAGKSTLVKIVAGVHAPTAGTIRLQGKPVQWRKPAEAQAAGVYTIYQELSLVAGLSAAENIYLSDLPRTRGRVDWRRLRHSAHEILASIGLDIDVRRPVGQLPVAQQQIIEIAKAVHRQAKVILLDEPTATLPKPEVEKLFDLLGRLRAGGVAIVYISHRLDEVYTICDRVTVLRDGQKITTQTTADLPTGEAVRAMVGERLVDGLVAQLAAGGRRRIHPPQRPPAGPPALATRGLSDERILRGVSVEVFGGQIVAVVGLVGNGQTELGNCVFGDTARSEGEILICGSRLQARSPRAAVRAGIGFVPEERKTQGLVLNMPIAANVTMANMGRVAPKGVLRRRREEAFARDIMTRIDIRAESPNQAVSHLSGGNQQKVVLAKWLAAGTNVIIFNEPTRGIDVAAKEEIYLAIRAFLDRGGAALLITSEVEEALMCDRIYVMSNGTIEHEFAHEDVDALQLLAALR